MSGRQLCIAFLWHMHQPNYRDPFTGQYRLPWVRLHGVKDYLDMTTILRDFPSIRQTFNVVPSLLSQIVDYTEHHARDRHLEVTLKAPSDLSEDDKVFLLEQFFLANWDTMVHPFPRYHELLMKRGTRMARSDARRMVRYFTDRDFTDLQVLFNLVWIDPSFRREDPFLRELMARGRDYTEEDKAMLIEKQLEILRRIIPTYREMRTTGQIELSVTPFYHPILPLLWDTDSARRAMPQVHLPRLRFAHPEDAVTQIRDAVAFYEKTFGSRPLGMWPSEGSVSEEVAGAIAAEGIRWVATDEEVLARSLERPLRGHEGQLLDAGALYRNYRYGELSLFFRDHRLSDQVGFVYSGMGASQAVDDFIGRLEIIRRSLPDSGPHVVPVILDGENAWEYYPNDGRDFLSALYEALSRDERFRTVTMSDFIGEYGTGTPLQRLHSGSWINGNFGIWIGHEEDNLAWDYLARARADLEAFGRSHPDADLREAWQALYAAEGSDWNWWYGDDHATETQDIFDELFRSYLLKVYEVMETEAPHDLNVPILTEDRTVKPDQQIRGFIRPAIDGLVSSYFEWYNAASVEVRGSGGSMHRSESCIKTVHYGFDAEHLYLRIDPRFALEPGKDDFALQVALITQATYKALFHAGRGDTLLYERGKDGWKEVMPLQSAAHEIIEIGIPFRALGAVVGEEVRFSLEIVRNGASSVVETGDADVERCPWKGYLVVTVPPAEYERIMWH